MKSSMISFENVSFQYDSQAEPTLKNIHLDITPGEKIVIVGPSGSGKSTLGQCINGLIPNIYKGEVQGNACINGHNIKETSLFDMSFEVGTVLQDTDGQFIGLSVGEDIAFSKENDEMPTKEMHQVVDKWLKAVELTSIKHHRPQDLSGGQKQRVSMAGVLVDDVPILLFDEPLANLDPHAGVEAMELIESLHEQTNATVIIIEHRLEDVLHIPMDRIIVMNEGEILAEGTPDELLKTDVFQKNGIREPLYLTGMKYAGVPTNQMSGLSHLAQLNPEVIRPKIQEWLNKTDVEGIETHPSAKLALNQLNYRYGRTGKKVLDNVTLTFNEGEMISIVGKNGAGKSTLAKAMCGFIDVIGDRTWEGISMNQSSIKEIADVIGYVMQNPNQMISQKMIVDEVGLGLVLRGVPQEEIQERVSRILKVCGLYPFRNWPISALSYGQKKRVTIASILVLEPKMIILDEPTAGQDFKHYTEIMSFLEDINKLGIIVVMITHDMHLMLEYTDRSIVLSEGKVVADMSPIDLLTNPTLVEASSLRETSLFQFAKHLKLEDPVAFVRTFTLYDREVRHS